MRISASNVFTGGVKLDTKVGAGFDFEGQIGPVKLGANANSVTAGVESQVSNGGEVTYSPDLSEQILWKKDAHRGSVTLIKTMKQFSINGEGQHRINKEKAYKDTIIKKK